ncbi:dihydropteroate synthase [Brumimicrobium salinarum]|uniref:dihydropteroate synthase n=1 Tax=Brumimicrobium salinarum TaxID=2058658 RepID=A0A2I0QYV6_9FLAO|nr:dihydropteroate synthase [Brumimicrobium salinarum]PKR79525.1 dihydropteroate synthase [Brumimicrobium salinarum]
MVWKDSKYDLNKWLKIKDKLHYIDSPQIMGVLNVTPDSFYRQSQNSSFDEAMQCVNQMVNAGVDLIDVGGVSTRPGADLLSTKQELRRVIPIIKAISDSFPELVISVDTFRAEVAYEAVTHGASIVNDVYGGRYDDAMFQTVAELGVPYVLMHSRGDAKDMQDKCSYEDVTLQVIDELSVKLKALEKLGVKDVIIDPGFGFAKTLSQNYQLFEHLEMLNVLASPLLIGISRKSMIYKLLNEDAESALNGTTVLNTVAALKKADFLRVHDVKEACEVKRIVEMLKIAN